MRNINIFIVCILYSIGCSRQPDISCIEGDITNEIKWGPASASSNLMDWSNAGAIFNNIQNSMNSVNLRIGKINNIKCDYYQIGLNNLPLIESRFDLNLLNQTSNFNSILTILHGGDAIAEQYELVDTINNYLIITDIKQDLIIGEYSLSYKVSENSIGKGLYDKSLPSVLYFKNGFFQAKLTK